MKLPIVSKSSDILYFKFFSSLFQAKSSLHFKSKNDNVSSQRITVEWPVKKSKIALPKVMSMPMLSDCYHWKLIGWGTPLEKEFDEPPLGTASLTPILPSCYRNLTNLDYNNRLGLNFRLHHNKKSSFISVIQQAEDSLRNLYPWLGVERHRFYTISPEDQFPVPTELIMKERDSAWTSTLRFDPWHKLAIKQQFS